jgi:hypothetical protein
MISNLSFSKIYRTDTGVYRCEGSNNIGHNGQFYWWRKPEYQETYIDLSQVTDQRHHKKWLKELQYNCNNDKLKDNSTASIAMISNLSFSKIYRTDTGVYRCEGSNNIGHNGVDSVYVNVLCNQKAQA